MKIFLQKLAVCVLISATGCSDHLNDGDQQVLMGEEVESGVGGTVTFLHSENGSIQVKVLSISDSRCPTNVICVWEGIAKVEFQVGVRKKIISLCTQKNILGCPKEEFFSEGSSYYLEVIDVTPYPIAKDRDVRKSVTFRLSLK